MSHKVRGDPLINFNNFFRYWWQFLPPNRALPHLGGYKPYYLSQQGWELWHMKEREMKYLYWMNGFHDG
jgi:hypothetical protein